MEEQSTVDILLSMQGAQGPAAVDEKFPATFRGGNGEHPCLILQGSCGDGNASEGGGAFRTTPMQETGAVCAHHELPNYAQEIVQHCLLHREGKACKPFEVFFSLKGDIIAKK